MSIRIVDSKKMDMTDDEFRTYESICKSYDDPPAVRGKDLFAGLFETNDNGLIVFLKTTKRALTMEVYLFLVNLSIHQHLREGYKLIAEATKRVDEALAKLDESKAKTK